MARVFQELADVLELSGESPFRVRAFRTAARSIEALGQPVASRLQDGTLGDLPGIGEGVLHRLKELVATGTLAELDQARAALPPGLMELMSLSGVGIKTARQVWKERGITNIDALEIAAKDGRLRDLPRFGAKREEKLLAAISAWRKRAAAPKRWPMAEALELAEAVCARLRALPHVLQCRYAGSLRRGRDTVGDIDVLAAADEGHARGIMDAFAAMPEVARGLAKGDTKTTVILAGGIQCDLRVVPQESYGAALQYFTGSKEHNVAMRTLAVKKKLKVSEYGVYDAGGQRVAGETEVGVYAAIGLLWMAPELRENRGEIDAARNGTLPVLVELADLVGDLHMHTTESDGRNTLEEMVLAARAAGRTYVAITDHSGSLAVARGLSRERLRAHVARIRALDAKLGGTIRVLAGIEADILADGSVDLASELGGLDWVVGSVHTQLEMPLMEMTRRVVKAIESGLIDCLGHPSGRLLGQREPSALDLDAVLAALGRTGVAIELNASPLRLDVGENVARMARDLGVPVCIDTDAHSTQQLGSLRYGVGIARRAWLGREHVLTTRSAEALADWRAARRS